MKVIYIAKIFVKKLNISMNDLQCQQLIIFTLNATAEVQACISTQRKQYKLTYQE